TGSREGDSNSSVIWFHSLSSYVYGLRNQLNNHFVGMSLKVHSPTNEVHQFGEVCGSSEHSALSIVVPNWIR
ncbi:hypothetical protein HAX54_014659, partial [Datura stramonium]|nr:hypothetical protein [Datura stramonium]